VGGVVSGKQAHPHSGTRRKGRGVSCRHFDYRSRNKLRMSWESWCAPLTPYPRSCAKPLSKIESIHPQFQQAVQAMSVAASLWRPFLRPFPRGSFARCRGSHSSREHFRSRMFGVASSESHSLEGLVRSGRGPHRALPDAQITAHGSGLERSRRFAA